MKILSLISLILLTISGYAQDVIKFKNSDNPNAEFTQIVKIIYVDDTYLYFYKPEDTSKTVFVANLQYLSEFQYNSIELGQNHKIIQEDSLLYVGYTINKNITLTKPLKWDKPFSIDLIITKRGEKFKVKVINKDSEYVTFALVDENYNLSKSHQKYSLDLISNIQLNTTYFYTNSNINNNLKLAETNPNNNLNINPNNYNQSDLNKQNTELDDFKSTLIPSAILFIGSGILKIMADNVTMPDPKSSNYANELQTSLDKIELFNRFGNYTMIGGGVFLLGASFIF